jgi:hypothetical protein
VSRARWVILTPSETEPEWYRRVTDAVAAAGLTPVPWTADLAPEVLNDSKAVVLADNAATALAAGVTPAAVVFTDPESSVAAIGKRHSPGFPQAFWLSSLMLAEASALPPECRVVSGPLAVGGDPVELLPGLVVRAPPLPPRPRGPRHAAMALRLYVDGRPPVGQSASVSPTLFLYDARGQVSRTPGVVETTGRVRTLLYGPYMGLPPGVWKTSVSFSVDEDAADRPYRFDWGDGDGFEEMEFMPGQAGVFEVELTREWTQPSAAQVRVVLMRAAFAGVFRLLDARITRVG